MINRLPDKWIYTILIFACAALFLPFIGGVHLFDWDEINFAEAAREMLVTGNYTRVQIDYEPFWEKPPLFIWMQAISMKIFGVNEFAARFPNAVLGIIVALVLYTIGKKLYDKTFGLLWALVYMGSILPSFYFRSGIIDPVFNLFMFLSVYSLWKFYSTDESRMSMRTIMIAGVFSGLAILTKGPVGFLMPAVTWAVFWGIHRKRFAVPYKEVVVFSLSAVAVASIWFGIELALNGAWFIETFIKYQIRLLTTGDAGHGQPFYYHPVVLLIGCFPASIFIFSAFKRRMEDSSTQHDFKWWMIILLGAVVIIFSIVKTKIVHYSSLAYFPITFLATYTAYRMIYGIEGWKRHHTILSWSLGGFLALLMIAFPILLIHKEQWIHLVKDQFARGNIEADIRWYYSDTIVGIVFLAGLVISFVYVRRRELLKAMIILYSYTGLSFSLLMLVLTPRIEQHVQGAVIDFYKSLVGKQCYVKVLGFKSYAQLYYIDKRPEQSPSFLHIPYDEFEHWLTDGPIDKPVYFVCKIQDVNEYAKFSKKVEIFRKNGFVFYVRMPDKSN